MNAPGTALPPTLARVHGLLEQPLRDAVATLAPGVRQVAEYHLGWVDADGRPVTGNGGKSLRAALALLSARAAGASEEAGVPAAVAVQLVHEFSLLHDDIMDGDTTRRHRPTAWTVFGSGPAVLAGDALFTRAIETLADAPSPHSGAAAAALVHATQELISGQSADLGLEARVDARLDETLTMAAQKTGALLGVAAKLGAILAGGPADLVAALERYGRTVGLAFQLVDDLLGIWGAPEVTGKPVFADLRARKMSVPVAVALHRDEPASRRLAVLLAHQPNGADANGANGANGADGADGSSSLEEDLLALAAKLVDEAGGKAWTEQEAARLVDEATSELTRVMIPADVREELVELAYFTVRREL